jgi:branched-chain amino acid transport system substrate-binding protein
MKKRIFSLLLALFFIFGMFGTGAFASKKPVKIGFIYILSGPFATYGQFAKKGALMAIDEINKSGGILGHPVEAYFEDSTAKPAVALRAIRKLVLQKKVDALIGLDSSGVAKSVVGTIEQLKTPLIITHAATPDVTGKQCNQYTFRISVNLSQNVKAAAILASKMNAKKWTTIGPAYAFGFQSWEYFQKYLKQLKSDAEFFPKEKVAFPPFKTTDFSPYITKVMNSNPDGVLISLWGGNLVNFIRQAKDMGFFNGKYQVLITLGAAIEVLSALGDKMPEGLWVGTRYWFLANDSDLNKKFVKDYYKKYKNYPSYNAHGAYSAVYAYKKAAEKAKSVSKSKIVKALEGLSIELPVGKVYIRAQDHQAVTDATWGKTKFTKKYPFAILDPIKVFPGKEVTRPVNLTGCNLK